MFVCGKKKIGSDMFNEWLSMFSQKRLLKIVCYFVIFQPNSNCFKTYSKVSYDQANRSGADATSLTKERT
jgi:type I site-specific restriction-modification system R (restriction) subunit